tara:strand:- start:50 stop:283 length:234 start_codon:yes stop_codon:yes gene_type:complete
MESVDGMEEYYVEVMEWKSTTFRVMARSGFHATDLLEEYPDHRGTYTDTVTGAEDFLVSVEEHEVCYGREVEELPEL